MGDLKVPWTGGGAEKPVIDDMNIAGDGITQRGSDPSVSMDGESGLKPIWPNPIVPTPGGQETSNSVSGLPLQPNRFEPSETPPEPPNLTDRNPGTIDKR